MESGQIRFILQIGLKSHPMHTKVPLLLDLVKGDEIRQMVEFMSVPTFVGRSIAAPPGVPTDRVDALRLAFDQTNVDAGYEALLKKYKLDVQFENGKDLQALMVKLSKTPKPMIQKVRDAIGMRKAK